MNLDGVLATVPGILAAIHDCWLVVINSFRRKRKVPPGLLGGYEDQAKASGVGRFGFADPLHSEMSSIRAITQPNNFVQAKFGPNAGQFCPLAADIDSEDLFGKDARFAVSAEDPYFYFDLLTRLAAPAHPFEEPPLRFSGENSHSAISGVARSLHGSTTSAESYVREKSESMKALGRFRNVKGIVVVISPSAPLLVPSPLTRRFLFLSIAQPSRL